MTTTESIVEALGGRRVLGAKISNLDELDDRLRSGLPYAALEAVTARFGIARAELSAALKLPQRTIARRKKEKRLHADESDRLFRLARIAAQAADVLGGEEQAAQWLRRPNRALGGQVPLSVLDTDLGARQVEAILGRIEHGVFS